MTAAEATKLVAVERLRAERQPGDAGRSERRRVASLVGTGVRLERDLRAVGDPEPLPDESDETGQSVGRQQRRRAAAEIDRLERRAARAPKTRVKGVGPKRDLGPERVRKCVDAGTGPRAEAPAYTTKSQYGQSETQNGTWT